MMVAANPVKAMDMAAKGNASFSLTIAAVPKPCAAAPMPIPRATGSSMPSLLRIVAPKLAPNIPVITTIETASDTLDPSIPAIDIAKGDVIFLDKSANRTEGSPISNNRTKAAVPKSPPTTEVPVAADTSNKFSFINCRFWYMEMAKEITAGPKQKRSQSPAEVPMNPQPPIRYDRNMCVKVWAVAKPNVAKTVQVTNAQVIIGCTTLMKFVGKRVPQTNEASVVNKRPNLVKNDFVVNVVGSMKNKNKPCCCVGGGSQWNATVAMQVNTLMVDSV